MLYRAVFVLAASLFSVAALGVATPASAQVNAGVQGGISVDPDQGYFGGHLETSPLVDRVRFRPNIDVGFGSDLTLVAVNFDFTYTFPARSRWALYLGAGPTLNFYNHDNGGSDTEGGFNFLIGAKEARGLFFEMKVGIDDSPDLKFGVGYTFR
jgi:hypothetical protein